MKSRWSVRVMSFAVASMLAGSLALINAGQAGGGAVQRDPDDIGGVVTGQSGPEAGVWVIAETTDLPTKFAKIVVTDDRGRYLLPDLPKARYKVWVRGYGLVDSAPVQAELGSLLDLKSVTAPTARAAAAIYPPNYWQSLLKIPPLGDFPGTGPAGNGISTAMKDQGDWVHQIKEGCQICHVVGTTATRDIRKEIGTFDSPLAAWDHRVQMGQMGAGMSGPMSRFGRPRGLAMFTDWTNRIAAGEVPIAPPRPRGRERDVVISLWDWNGPTGFVHDNISTDKRNPSVNANGPLYGADQYNGRIAVLDPVANRAWTMPLPTREPVRPFLGQRVTVPSPAWGQGITWTGTGRAHTPMIDSKGRVWVTSQIRAGDNVPVFCEDGTLSKFADYFPLSNTTDVQLSMYDPKTEKWTLIDTCTSTHHLQFAHDADNTLYLGGDFDAIGWVNTRVFDETKDLKASVGWCPNIVDTNGDGKITEWVEPNQPLDPRKDKRIRAFPYGIAASRVDNSIWWPLYQSRPGQIVRLDRGSNPPQTCKAELYQVPVNHPDFPGMHVYNPRGIDMDANGVVWIAFGSGHKGSFDRRKCKTLIDRKGTGEHCAEGWTFYQAPGPNYQGNLTKASTEWPYLEWVDQHNVLGLGKDVPIMNGTASDSLLAFLPDRREWIVMRVPYPLGFYSRSVDGRIDDPQAGWKGRGLWSTYAMSNVWHIEGGKGTQGKVVKFQLRPNPLAK